MSAVVGFLVWLWLAALSISLAVVALGLLLRAINEVLRLPFYPRHGAGRAPLPRQRVTWPAEGGAA